MTASRTAWLLLALVLVGCVDRQVSIDEEEEIERVTCMVLIARGWFADGTTWTITNEWDTTGTVCMCMTREELDARVYFDELNERGLEECLRLSKLHWDFAWTNCEENYEQGEWLYGLFPVVSEDDEWMNPHGLTCGDELQSTCTIQEREPTGVPWALLVLVAALAWSRRTGAARVGPA
jgi:hypothetical protein